MTTALRPASPSSLVVGHAQRDGHHRGACGVDTRLAVHPLADRQRALGQLVQGATDGVVGLGGGVGAAHLAEHLLLTDDRRVQATGDGEQMLDGRLGVADVGVLGEVAQRHTGMFGEHLADHRQAAVEGIDDRVHLDPVAGGQHHGLGHQRGLQHLFDDLGLIGLVGAQLLQHGDRRAAVRNAEKQHAHGFITTSSTVVGYQLGYQICYGDAQPSFRKICPQPGLVELPVTVLRAVEKHHRKPIAELGAQRGITRRGRRVDVGAREFEPELVGQLSEPGGGPFAQGTALAGSATPPACGSRQQVSKSGVLGLRGARSRW